jgi:Na+/H+ antiporter NhaA
MGSSLSSIKRSLHHEAASGVLLMLATVAAPTVANSGVDWSEAVS